MLNFFFFFFTWRNVSVTYVTLVPWRREQRRHVGWPTKLGSRQRDLSTSSVTKRANGHWHAIIASSCRWSPREYKRQQVHRINSCFRWGAEPVTRQLSGGTATVATWRLRSLLQGTRVTYITETFPFSRSLRVTSDDQRNWDPYQSATGAAPSSALCRPPDPSYKADDRTGLYTEKVNYCCSLSNPNSRTWITLGSVPFRLEEAHCGVTSSQRG